MKYVSSLPPPISGVPDRVEVEALAAVGPIRPVQPRSLPPLVTTRPHPLESASPTASPEQEKRVAAPSQQERRVYCRRYMRHSLLMELRSTISRRRNGQRKDDRADNIDEFA